MPNTSVKRSTGSGLPWLRLLAIAVVLYCGWGFVGQQLAAPYLDTWLGVPRGRLDVIAPGQWYPSGGKLSPDGRRMLLGWTRNGTHEAFILDLATGVRIPFSTQLSGCWISADQIAGLGNSDTTYYVIDAHTGQSTRLGSVLDPKSAAPKWLLPLPQITVDALRARLEAAIRITAINAFVNGGYTLFTEEHDGQHVYFGFPNADVKAILDTVPHTLLNSACNMPPYDPPLVSPDGRYYARVGYGPRNWLRIYNQNGEVVVEANKAGWTFRWMGWASDSSGMYFFTESQASMLTNHAPYSPVFKLSVLTPEEERAAAIWQGVWWAAAIAVLAAGVWWWWRRRARAA